MLEIAADARARYNSAHSAGAPAWVPLEIKADHGSIWLIPTVARAAHALADPPGQCPGTQRPQRPDRRDRRRPGQRRLDLPIGLPGAAGRVAFPGRPADRDASADRDGAGDPGRTDARA